MVPDTARISSLAGMTSWRTPRNDGERCAGDVHRGMLADRDRLAGNPTNPYLHLAARTSTRSSLPERAGLDVCADDAYRGVMRLGPHDVAVILDSLDDDATHATGD